MKHLIIEGPDGSGKSTLIKQLVEDYDLELHARASDSVDGPVPDIYDWAKHDATTWAGMTTQNIYDRHPLISELIYGPLCRGKIDGRFLQTEGAKLIKQMYSDTVMIVCLPDLDVVKANLSSAGQMAGVNDNIEAIYEEYKMMFATVPLWAELILHDYTRPDAYQRLERLLGDTVKKR